MTEENGRLEAGKQLAQQFDRMHGAFEQAYKKRQGQLAIHDAVMDSLPEDPERGSYYWWAKMCRENTGSSMLDSGGAYEYQYMRGVLPEDGSHLHLSLWDGNPESWSINLPKFLETMFDASGEIPEAIERVLYWVGEWLYPREPWGGIIKGFPAILNMLYACIQEQKNDKLIFRKALAGMSEDSKMHDIHKWAEKGEVGVALNATRMIEWYFDKLTHKSDFRSYQQNLTEIEFIEQALADLPVKAIKLLYENEIGKASGRDIYDNPGTFYTYNQDNDFNQDWMVDLWLSDEWNDLHAIIRTHNGCDARGGYSSPAVATVNDIECVYSWQVDGYCTECHEQYESMYWYSEKAKRPQIDVGPLRAYFIVTDQLENGQAQLPDMPEAEPLPISEKHARAILDYHDAQLEEIDEEDIDFPLVMLKVGDLVMLDDDAPNCVADEDVEGLYCPKCGKYAVGFYSPVYEY